MPQYTLEELQDIIERQRKVYGDLLDKVIIALQHDGHNKLADEVQAAKIMYGLGKFVAMQETKPSSAFRVRPRIYEDTIERDVMALLTRNRGQRFKAKDIFLNISGQMTEYAWYKVRAKLIAENKIKQSGWQYWVE